MVKLHAEPKLYSRKSCPKGSQDPGRFSAPLLLSCAEAIKSMSCSGQQLRDWMAAGRVCSMPLASTVWIDV